MAKSTLSDTEQVAAYIKKLDQPLAETVEEIRTIILATDKEVAEQIKWNSPAFYYTGDMKPFDPKEYKRDIVVMNLHRGHVLLVFPTGATIKDTTGLLEGKYTDGRRIAKIMSLEEAKEKATSLQRVIKAWLQQVDK